MPKFMPGQSGNPAGKKKGTQNKRSQLGRLLEPHAGELVAKAVALALSGDINALRLCVERLIPKATHKTAFIELPSFEATNCKPPLELRKALLEQIQGQTITLEEVKALTDVLTKYQVVEENDAGSSERLNALIEKCRRDY